MSKWPVKTIAKENTSWIVLDNIFTDLELDRIVIQGNAAKKITSTLGDGIVSDYRACDIAWLASDEVESDFDWIYATLSEAIKKVNTNHFQFDITHLTALQFTMYDGKQQSNYKKHLDLGKQFPNRKLSFSVQLSEDDDYTGGDLRFHYIKSQPEVAPRRRGQLIFFPSWTVHDVTPVTQGIRYSLVGWVSGPNFK